MCNRSYHYNDKLYKFKLVSNIIIFIFHKIPFQKLTYVLSTFAMSCHMYTLHYYFNGTC